MPPVVHDFDNQLQATLGPATLRAVEVAVRQRLPEVLKVEPAPAGSDRLGCDFVLHLPTCQFRLLEAKFREQDFGARGMPDVALETFNDLDRGTPGWARDFGKASDYVLVIWRDTGRSAWFPARELRAWFDNSWQQLREQYGSKITTSSSSTGRWRSEAIFVPSQEIYRQIALWQGFQKTLEPRQNDDTAAGRRAA